MPRWPISQSSITTCRAASAMTAASICAAACMGSKPLRGVTHWPWRKASPRRAMCSTNVPADGIALQYKELLRNRRDDLGLVHLFAGQRHVVQPAVACQEPFAGRIQRAEIILQDVVRIGLPGIPWLHRLAAGRQAAIASCRSRRGTAACCPSCDRRPGSRRGDLSGPQRPNACWASSAPHAHRLLRRPRAPFRGSIERCFAQVLHVEEELIRRTCPRGTVAVDEQLLEIPAARGHFRNMQFSRCRSQPAASP